MAKLKSIPQFKTEDEERAFWKEHDSSDYIDWKSSKQIIFPNLKPSTETISLRLPLHLLESIKSLANKKDIPYQSLIKMMLADSVKDENRTRKKNPK